MHKEEIIKSALLDVAKKMLLAAKTAPKGRGTDNMVYAIAEEKEIKEIAAVLKKMGQDNELPGLIRDADNILLSPVMLLLGTKIKPMGLKKCGFCGFGTCAGKEKYPEVPCAFNTGDLGIAVGSAVSVAMDNRVDNRIMYSVGLAVLDMKIFDPAVKIVYAIPLSGTSKNPFFDRK